MKRSLTALLLAGVLILSGCGAGNKKQDSAPAVKYTAQYIPLDIDADVSRACISDGNVWLAGYSSDGVHMRAYLAAADEAGNISGDFSDALSATPPEGRTWENSAVNAVFPLPDGGAAVYGCDTYSYMDVNNPLILPDGRSIPTSALESVYFAVSVNPSGEPTGRIELTEEQGGNVLSFASDGENYYLMDSDGKIQVLRPDGSELCAIQTAIGSELAPLGGGRVACVDAAGNVLPVDAENSRLGSRIGAENAYTAQSYTLFPGGAGWDMLMTSGTTLFGCNNNGERGEIVTWLNADINGRSVMYVSPLKDGDGLVCVCGDENGGERRDISVVRLTPTDGDGSDRTVLRMFCVGLNDDISKQVLSFNRTSPDYRIEVRDYAAYSDGLDASAAYTRMNVDLMAGDVPDVFCTDGLPVDTYAARGMLEDLWPYIDADTEFGGRDALVLPLFEAMSIDGCLYEVTDGFGINTVAGHAGYAVDGWSMADFMAAYDKMPAGCSVFGADFTRLDALYLSLALRLDELIDEEQGTCRFDGEEFRKIVEFTELFPETGAGDNDEFSRIASGEQMLASVWVTNVFGLDSALCAFGEDGAALGMPGAAGNGSAFSPGSGLAMSASSAHKDGAWSFLRRLLLAQNQQTDDAMGALRGRLPSNRAALERLIGYAGTPDMEDGKENPKFVTWSQGHEYAAYALTEEKTAALRELIDSTENVYKWDDSIFELISGELNAYYNGDKTLAQAAGNIQSRVELYLQSQK